MSKFGKKYGKNKKKDSKIVAASAFDLRVTDDPNNDYYRENCNIDTNDANYLDSTNDIHEKLNNTLSLNSPYYDNAYSINYPQKNPLTNEPNKKKIIHHGEYSYASTDELKKKLQQLKQNNKLCINTDSEEQSDNTVLKPNNLNGSQQSLESNNSYRSINSRTPSPTNVIKKTFVTELSEITLKSPIIMKHQASSLFSPEKELSNGNPNQVTLTDLKTNENSTNKIPIIKFRSVSNSSTSTTCNTSSTIKSKNEETSTEKLFKQNIKYASSGTNTEDVERVSVATNTEIEFHSVEINTEGIQKSGETNRTISLIENNKKKKLNSYLITIRFIIILLRTKKFAFSLENTFKKFMKKANDENVNWNGLYLDKIIFGRNEYIVIQKLYNVPKMVTYPEFDVSNILLKING